MLLEINRPATFDLKSEELSMRKTSCLPLVSLLSFALILCCSLVSFGQNREKFVISAKAGGINAITGGASVSSRGESDWQQLNVTDDLNSGDRVRTADDGRVEILLNPGSYLRLGGNSEVELLDNSLANLEVKLLRGTAIVEATGADGLELNIGISTPHTRLAIVRQGLYRLNVVPDDATELIVRKGRVILSDSHTKVKGGNKVIFSATAFSVAKLTNEEKKNKDDVEVWSKQRAETVARANRQINNRMLTSAFTSFRTLNWPYDNRSLGLWFFNPRLGCYTFLPFYFGWWASPYGLSYTNSVYVPSSSYLNVGSSHYPPASGNGTTGGQSYPSSTGGGRPAPAPVVAPNGGFGNSGNGGGIGREPRILEPASGNRKIDRASDRP